MFKGNLYTRQWVLEIKKSLLLYCIINLMLLLFQVLYNNVNHIFKI